MVNGPSHQAVKIVFGSLPPQDVRVTFGGLSAHLALHRGSDNCGPTGCHSRGDGAIEERDHFVGQSNGDDRILLARWMTLAFSAHPAVQDAVSRDMTKVDETNQQVAALFTALLTERCVNEAKAAVAAEGDAGAAMQKAFEMLGAVASQEAMMAPEVSETVNGFIAYVDEAALMSALGQ